MTETTKAKAAQYLSNTQAWLRLRNAAGRIVGYGLPSTSVAGLFHRCRPGYCDCRSFSKRGWCSHEAAATSYVALKRREQMHALPATAPERAA